MYEVTWMQATLASRSFVRCVRHCSSREMRAVSVWMVLVTWPWSSRPVKAAVPAVSTLKFSHSHWLLASALCFLEYSADSIACSLHVELLWLTSVFAVITSALGTLSSDMGVSVELLELVLAVERCLLLYSSWSLRVDNLRLTPSSLLWLFSLTRLVADVNSERVASSSLCLASSART